MQSGKADLQGRSINKRTQENAGCPGGGGCIRAESKDGCAPNSNFFASGNTVRFQVPLKDPPF